MHPYQPIHPAVFLDRDGVLNHLVDRGEGFMIRGVPHRFTAPWKPEEVRLVDGVRLALAAIQRKGYKRIMVTNQPDVATGNMTESDFEKIMEKFRKIEIDGLYYCKHAPGAGCKCRKPEPGMLLTATRDHDIDLRQSYMVGDLESDIQAGQAINIGTIRLVTEPGIVTAADYTVRTLQELAERLPTRRR